MRLYLAIILAISFLENFKVLIIRGTLGSQPLAMNGCLDLRTELDLRQIKQLDSYEIHHHPQKLVIFITKRGIKLCVPHDVSWVRDAIRKLNQKKRKTRDLRNLRRSNNQTNRTTT